MSSRIRSSSRVRTYDVGQIHLWRGRMSGITDGPGVAQVPGALQERAPYRSAHHRFRHRCKGADILHPAGASGNFGGNRAGSASGRALGSTPFSVRNTYACLPEMGTRPAVSVFPANRWIPVAHDGRGHQGLPGHLPMRVERGLNAQQAPRRRAEPVRAHPAARPSGPPRPTTVRGPARPPDPPRRWPFRAYQHAAPLGFRVQDAVQWGGAR